MKSAASQLADLIFSGFCSPSLSEARCFRVGLSASPWSCPPVLQTRRLLPLLLLHAAVGPLHCNRIPTKTGDKQIC